MLTNTRRFLGSLFYWIYLPLGIIYSVLMIYINSIGKKAEWVTYQDIYDKKTSDTLFILGSGESINSYSKEQWEEIIKNDSLGFNLWILHEHVPSFYMIEFPRDYETLEIFKKNMQLIIPKYDKTLIFLKEGIKGKKNIELLPVSLRKKIKVLFNPTIPILKEKNIRIAFRLMSFIIKRRIYTNKLIVFSKRASLFSAVLIGYLTGYKKIVLCGIDLNNNNYFYDTRREEIKNKGLFVPEPIQKEDSIHRTNNEKYGEVTISKLIVKLNELILKPNNVDLYIGSDKSALAKFLPLYWRINR